MECASEISQGGVALFVDSAAGAMGPDFGRNSEYFYNPLINSVKIQVAGVSSQLYDPEMRRYHHWDAILKGFAHDLHKDAALPSIDQTTFFQNRYGLWLDFRTSDDNAAHGSARNIDGSISLKLGRTKQAAGEINCYVYLVMDAHLNIEGGRVKEVIW